MRANHTYNYSFYNKIGGFLMGKIIKIKNNDIENILLEVSRQYLVGNLKRPQKLDFIKDTNLEIGITNYYQYSTRSHIFTQKL